MRKTNKKAARPAKHLYLVTIVRGESSLDTTTHLVVGAPNFNSRLLLNELDQKSINDYPYFRVQKVSEVVELGRNTINYFLVGTTTFNSRIKQAPSLTADEYWDVVGLRADYLAFFQKQRLQEVFFSAWGAI
jgi:hypothetical protein